MKFERYKTKELPYESEKGEEHDFTRRQFFAMEAALAAAGIAATSGVLYSASQKDRLHPLGGGLSERQPDVLNNIVDAHVPQQLPGQDTSEAFVTSKDWYLRKRYQMPSELVGESMNPLERMYIEPIPGESLPAKDAEHPTIPAFPEVFPPIDFAANLEHMHKKKLALASDSTVATQKKTFERLSKDYREKWERNEVTRMDLKEFRNVVERQSYKMIDALATSYPRIIHAYVRPILMEDTSLTERDRENVLKQMPAYLDALAKRLTPEIMMTYMAVELMPSRERSAALLEFLTKNAGVEYLAAIPALGDKLLSYGPFQLTKFVIAPGTKKVLPHDNDNPNDDETVLEGQGSVTRLLSVMGQRNLVPSSLGDFNSIEQHIRAGYLFAFDNILSLITDAMRDRRYHELIGIAESANGSSVLNSSTVFVEYLSAAHHRPVVARKAMNSWLGDNNDRDTYSRDRSLMSHFPLSIPGQQVRTYAKKAQTIFGVLRPYLK